MSRDTEQATLFEHAAIAQEPTVSIVIVHFRTPDVLRVCLDAIDSAKIGPTHEVIVIDNAPLDDEAERICGGRSGVSYRRNPRNIGFGRAVNQGLQIGRGAYLLVLNPDVEIRPGSIEELIAEMDRDPSIGIAAPRLLYQDGTLQHSCRTFYTMSVFLLRRTFLGRLWPKHRLLREHLMLDYDHETTRPVDWCLGASLLVRRRALEDVGGMDERFFLYFEDVDWCYRMQARGWKVVYHPAATMTHRYARESARKPGRGLLIHLASTFRYYEKWSFLLYWIKRRTSAIRRIVLIISDFAAINAAFVIAYLARDFSAGLLAKPTFGFGRYARFLLFTDAVALLALALAGMYRSRRREEAGEQLLGAARSIAATALIMMASTFLFSTPVYSRLVVGLFLPTALVLILLARYMIFRVQGNVRSHRIHLRRVGLLAPDAEVAEISRRLESHPDLGFEVLPLTSNAAVLERPRGGHPREIDEAIVLWAADERIAEVVLFEDWPGGGVEEIASRLGREGVPVRIIPAGRSMLRDGARMTDFLGFPALQVAGMSGAARSWEKRLFDLVAATGAICVTAIPYLLLRGVVWALGDEWIAGDFVGRRGRIVRFSFPRLGRRFALLREFPRLLLWLRGEWSLVGIHPFQPSEWDALPQTYRRFPPDAAPGWVTLAGPAEGKPRDSLAAANVEYVGRFSLALDLDLVIGRLSGRGGYR